MDILRGWNERSFLGWKAWWLRIAGIGWIAAALQSLWLPAVFSVYLVIVWILGLGALLLVLGQGIAWAGKMTPRSALAGLLRYAPVIWIVPLIDALAVYLIPRANGSIWWIAPSGFLERFLLAGCDLKACSSPGLTILSLLIPVALGWLLIRFGWKWGKVIGLAVFAYFLFWLILTVPSFTAWTRLSSYGTTLAAPSQVVEQAFNRTWAASIWYTNRESFWTLSTVGNQGVRILIGAMLLWLLCFGLLAPLLARPSLARDSWRRRLSQGAFVLPPLILGALLGFKPLPTSFWMSTLMSGVFFAAVAVVAWKALTLIDDEDADPDTRWMIVTFALSGAFLLGWPTACAFAIALLIRWWAGGATLLERIFALATSAWFLMLAAWSLFARADWSAFPRGLFFGLFLFLVGLAAWNEYGTFVLEGDEEQRLFGAKGPIINRSFVWGILFVAILLLWLSTLALGLVWIVAALAAISAAILWLFSSTSRNVVLFSWFACILMGVALHSAG